MSHPSLYDEPTFEGVRQRIGALGREAQAQWGRMNAAQMCAHCAEVLEVANGKPLVGTPWFIRLLGGVIKRMVLSDKPYPRGSKTHPQYEISPEVEFDEEKARLLAAVDALYEGRSGSDVTRHPLFGEMTAEETGCSMYKHLDHHLTQFGV